MIFLTIGTVKKQSNICVKEICLALLTFWNSRDIIKENLKKGSFDILEPTSNDKVTSNNCVCIVPGICFDKNGYRIGYGKGYYDKYLSNKSIYKIGICFKECLIDNMPHDLYDIKVDLIVSSF